MAGSKLSFDSDSIIDFLKRNTSLLIIIITFGSLVLFGYVEFLYYQKVLVALGFWVSLGAPIIIEGVKFVFLLSSYSSAIKVSNSSTWFNLHLLGLVIGLATSGFVVAYQFREVTHMAKIWGNNQYITDFAYFFVIVSLLLEFRLVILLSTK